MAAYSEGVIYIDGEIDPALALSTLWHEAVHIVQIDLHGKPDEKEARWVSLFAHALLMHNPEIIEAYGEMPGIIRTDSRDCPGRGGERSTPDSVTSVGRCRV